jgi:N-acetylneuraminate lyase
MEKLRGLIAAPFTPMEENGDINYGQIETLNQLYENNGINGAFVGGSTGEGASLSFNEKKTLIQAWGRIKSPKIKTLMMLGGTSLKEMQELALHTMKCNLDGVSILSPYYYRPASVHQLVDFCKKVTEVVPELPFYYYHIPGLTGGNFSMTEFLKISEDKLPNLTGIKYSSSNIMDCHLCHNYKDGKYDILWGVDEALLSGLSIGIEGAVGSTYNYAAPLYNQIIEAFQNKDLVNAEKLQLKAAKMVELLVKYGGMGAGKAFMKLIGVDCGWFRQPVSRPTDDQVLQLKNELEEIGFFDFCSKLY